MGTRRQIVVVANHIRDFTVDSNKNRVDICVNAIAAMLSPVVYRNIGVFITGGTSLP